MARGPGVVDDPEPRGVPSPWTVPGPAYATPERIEASGLPPSTAGPTRPVNVLAAVSVLLVLFLPPVAAVLGGVALWQIRRTGERGWGMALAGLAMGVMMTLVYVIGFIFVVAMASWPGPGG